MQMPIPTIEQKGDKFTNYMTMVGHICSDINQGALTAALPFLVVGNGYSYVQAAMLIFASSIASAIIQPVFGWIGDKHACPWFMALGIFLAGLGMCGIGYAGNYGLVLVCAVVCGIGVAMFHPEGGRLANLAAGERKSNGMSIFAVGGNIGFFVGPLLAAGFLSVFGMRGTLVFFFPATICAFTFLLLNARFKALGKTRCAKGALKDSHEHWGKFGLLMGVLSLRSMINYGLIVFIPLFLIESFGQGEVVGSVAISVFAVAGAVATILSGRVAEKFGVHWLMAICLAATFLGILVFAFNSSVVFAFVLTVILAITVDLFYPSSVALGMSYVPRHLAMAAGLCYGVAVCVGGAAEPFLGLAGDAFGLMPVVLVLAAIALVSTFIALVVCGVDKARRPSPRQTAHKVTE